MKRIKTLVALLMALAMLVSLTACGNKGADVTGKYICIGESYGGDYSEPYSDSWVELNKGGKGVYHAGFDFKLKWKLSGEDFNATVQFLGMEETMAGTLKNGMLEVKYGEGLMLRFLKEGMESAEGPSAEPLNGTESENGVAAPDSEAGTGEKTGANENAVLADTLVGAFEGAGASDSTGADMVILRPESIDNPSTWFGYILCSNYWGDVEENIFKDAYAVVNTEKKPYFEIFLAENTENPILSMYMSLEENGRTVRPDIGSEDAWMLDNYLEAKDEEAYTFRLFDDGTLVNGVDYTAPDGSYGFHVEMFFRPDGSLWDENNETLPPGYAAYKTDHLTARAVG